MSSLFYAAVTAGLLREAADDIERKIQDRYAGCPRTQDTLRYLTAGPIRAAARHAGIAGTPQETAPAGAGGGDR